jgi:hypothetical protein
MSPLWLDLKEKGLSLSFCMQIDLSVKGQLDKITQELQSNPQLAVA